MISDENLPQLTDFGLVFIIDHNEFTTSKIAGPARWTAPETLDPPESDESSPYTKESDVYAFAMTAVEVCTGKAPYSDRRNDSSVIFFVIGGGRPSMPDALKQREPITRMIEQCWDQEPRKRPSAYEVCAIMDTELAATTDGVFSLVCAPVKWMISLTRRYWHSYSGT